VEDVKTDAELVAWLGDRCYIACHFDVDVATFRHLQTVQLTVQYGGEDDESNRIKSNQIY